MSDDWTAMQNLDIYDVINILDKRLRLKQIKTYERSEERLWNQYLVLFGNMDKKTYRHYSKYLKESGLKHPFEKENVCEKTNSINKGEIIDISLRIKNNDKRERTNKEGGK